MQERKLGPFQVSALAFGCMSLSYAYGVPPSPEHGERVLLAALDAGITHFDTAALYGFGVNEQLVGRVLKAHRSKIVLASKGGMAGVDVAGDGKLVRVIDGRPEALRKNCEDSLRRLGTDVIDLYYLHRWDKKVPIEDSVGGRALHQRGEHPQAHPAAVPGRAARRVQQGHESLNHNLKLTRCAFVSTNSITQGEQVGVLWGWLLAQGVHIHFAHRTFSWSNEARGKAAVHCVIVGFGLEDRPSKVIYEYEDIKGEPHAVPAKNINPYLVDAPDVVLPRRSSPICAVPEIGIGNKPIDDGNYLFSTKERDAFIAKEPTSVKWFRRWLGADEFLNGYERWCLWLGDCPPAELRAMPEVMKRVQAVKAFRLASKSAPTQKLAETPTRFHVENMPATPYLVLPEVSSERRLFIPFGFEKPTTLCSNLVKVAPGATLFHFGVLSSTMHNAWVRSTCGRLKSDFRYSKDIVYNNYPWPESPTEAQRQAIETAAQGVLDARVQFPGASLADLYDPLTMPPALLKAHQKLDVAVDKAYEASGGRKSYKSDAERVAFLFDLYQKYTSLLPATPTKKVRAASAK